MKSASAISFTAAMGLLALSATCRADRVFWTTPSKDSKVFTGCPLKLGFRVQYSDLAQLSYVQLQVLDAQNKVFIDNIDNSTRTEWDDQRAKNITLTVPQELAPGDYILRAFGTAHYPCRENEHRTFCPLELQDLETIHVQRLKPGQSCPNAESSSSSSLSTVSNLESGSTTNLSSLTADGAPSLDSSGSSEPSSGPLELSTASPPSTSVENNIMDAIHGLLQNDGSSSPSSSSLNQDMQTPMHIQLDPSLMELMRQNGVDFPAVEKVLQQQQQEEQSKDIQEQADADKTNEQELTQTPSLTDSMAANDATASSSMRPMRALGSGLGLVILAVAGVFM
ncbi:hypothetical protein EDD11_002088 [Mortierella claussenii]|nr:hypothetical protein EDD11_002088 [Mortierella claussenii]